uniref:non-specific serine/threonine protein kinase n=1 Tax=Arcella intermedia TaxID=1963864 RepID=A0A6B2LDH6_9EUKA
MRDVLEEDRFLYIVMEYAPGGDLFTHVQKHGHLSETKARYFFKQMVDAVQFCHEKKIVHHDVKLENMLLQSLPEQSLRLSDFGLSQKIHPTESISACCGSPLYMAPEVFSTQPHNELVDVWSLGVCLYVMVSGTFPFVANSYSDLEEKVLFYDPSYLVGISATCNDLLQGMLRKDPLKRYAMSAIKQHKWVVEGNRYV